MKSIQKKRLYKRVTGQVARRSLMNNQAGQRIKLVQVGDDEPVPVQVVRLPSSISAGKLSVSATNYSAADMYTTEQIRRAGGINALSAAIGNNKPIKISPTKFTDAEWAQMNADMVSDE